MQVTNIRIKLCQPQSGRLKAFCALTFDHTFVVRDIKLIEGHDGVFLAMPSRKVTDHCGRCGDKNHLRARYCNNCGGRLDENRMARQQHDQNRDHHRKQQHSQHLGEVESYSQPAGNGRVKLHADIAHPISANCRQAIEDQVMAAFAQELHRSQMPGYIPSSLDGEDGEYYDSLHNIEPAMNEAAGNVPAAAIH